MYNTLLIEIGLALIIMISVLILSYIILPKNTKVQKFFKRNKILHPNSISYWRIFGGIPLTILYYYSVSTQNQVLILITIELLVFLAISDLLDGCVARNCNLITEKGKSLDALADKWFDLPLLLLLTFLVGPISFILAILITIFDIIGQTIRGKYSSAAAGIAGKAKTSLKFITIYFLSLYDRYPDLYHKLNLDYFVPSLLISATILAGISMAMKTKWFNDNLEEKIKKLIKWLAFYIFYIKFLNISTLSNFSQLTSSLPKWP